MDMVSATKRILVAAIALTLMDKKPSMTMDMLFNTLDDMSPDGIPDKIYPLADMHNNCVKKAQSYGIDYSQVKTTAENILLDYCQNYYMDMQQANDPAFTDAG